MKVKTKINIYHLDPDHIKEAMCENAIASAG